MRFPLFFANLEGSGFDFIQEGVHFLTGVPASVGWKRSILPQGIPHSGSGTTHCKSWTKMFRDDEVSTTGAQPLTH